MANGTCPIVEFDALCGRSIAKRGWCNRHYLRWRRNGDPVTARKRPQDVSFGDWFWRRVDRRTDDCWPWLGCRTRQGYGRLGDEDGRLGSAHRIAWRLTYGPIPDGLMVCHFVCDNPPCCNPAHLRLGTGAQNMVDMAGKGRARTRRERIPAAVAIEARRRRAAGQTLVSIADQLGVSTMTVSEMLRRKRRWARE